MINGQPISLDALQQLSVRPPLFAPGEALFWDDPHISQQMLAAHLNPNTEAASRPPDVIDRTVNWLAEVLPLEPGDAVLDLGCGPGLYAERLARRGLRVTGLDYSQRSISYARQVAAEKELGIEYRYQNYLTLDEEAQYDAVLLIYGDLCVLSPEKRDALLDRVHRALKPGGQFAFDVTTRRLRARLGLMNRWYVAESGFWKPGPHLVLEQGFDYPEHDTYLDQYIVIEADGQLSVYRNWFLDYAPDTITPVLEARGFAVRGCWGDLAGSPYTPESEWIGLVARKV
ncbi:MAG TPA: class I SAM-dependent methyltransferase [Aggregatilineaceae bacterium]|nr:class I SAM-dependent methyltransferase [Aggregatilineaceae bacterium]